MTPPWSIESLPHGDNFFLWKDVIPWVAVWGLSLQGQTLRTGAVQAWPVASGGPWGSMHPKDSPGIPFLCRSSMVSGWCFPREQPQPVGMELRRAWDQPHIDLLRSLLNQGA